MSDNNITSKILKSQATVRPFIYNYSSISVINLRYLILLCLQIALLVFTKSYSALMVIGFSTLGSLGAASLCYLLSKKPPYRFLSIIVQGIMIGMLIPETYPFLTVFVISFCVLFITKFFVFQNINSWINVVAISVIMAWIIGSRFFPSFSISSDLIVLKNPSYLMIQNGAFPVYNFDIIITDFLNKKFFNYLKVTVPAGYISMLCDSKSIIPAFRFNLMIIISSIILFSDNSKSGLIPSVFLVVYAVLVRLFAPVFFGGSFNQGDIILALLTSGTLFCAVFVLQWFGTTPVSMFGKFIYGLFSGFFAFLIAGSGTSPIGMLYTVLICNILNMMIRLVEEKYNTVSINKLIAKKEAETDVSGEK